MKLVQAAAVAGAVLFAAMPAQAQQDYPNAPIRIVCGFAPGSTADLSARVVGAKMGQILGQQIVVESRLGAASSLAGAAVAKAPKDGYTLYVASAANLINAAMSSSATLNFDFVKDFTPITLLTSTPTVLVMHPDAGVKTVKELIALAKAKPDSLSFGSSGVASSTHLALELFKSLAQVKITHVPYSGSPPVVTDLLAGRLQGFFAPASSVMEHVKSGKLIALAVTESKRSVIFPDLPTMIEAGVPDFESVLWFGIVAPTGTPKPIIDKLSKAANEALKSQDVISALKAQSTATVGGSPEDFGRYIAAEEKRWVTVVNGANLKK